MFPLLNAAMCSEINLNRTVLSRYLWEFWSDSLDRAVVWRDFFTFYVDSASRWYWLIVSACNMWLTLCKGVEDIVILFIRIIIYFHGFVECRMAMIIWPGFYAVYRIYFDSYVFSWFDNDRYTLILVVGKLLRMLRIFPTTKVKLYFVFCLYFSSLLIWCLVANNSIPEGGSQLFVLTVLWVKGSKAQSVN